MKSLMSQFGFLALVMKSDISKNIVLMNCFIIINQSLKKSAQLSLQVMNRFAFIIDNNWPHARAGSEINQRSQRFKG
jgi:hypothetical protein